MKTKKVALLLMLCCMCMACGTKEETIQKTIEETKVTVEVNSDTVSEATVISPLPSTIDINALDNCTVAVSFSEGDIFVNETGETQLKVTVHEYDLYDMVDIATLKEGDKIVIRGKEVLVESVETLESGLLLINGGIDNGGHDLWHNESGVFFEHGYSDTKVYQPIGDVTVKVSEDFEFVDRSDLDKGEIVYHTDDLIKGVADIVYNFTPNNTSIIIENGEVTHLIRIYTP